jgi:coenzyme F420-reducing hydrogenase beta subunit
LASSSGGVFFGLAQRVLSEGGVVFAAVYSDDCKTVEFASSDDIPLTQMLKSKYVESMVGLSFRRIKDELERGRRVLFCGTPCQVAGLQRYLKKAYDSLITCDFACGGLPSHAIYQSYLQALESKYRSPVQSVDFRPKTHGWKRYVLRVGFQNGKEHLRLGTEDLYLRSFLHGKFTVRDYCLECKFPECHASDITLADFWLHEKLSSLKHEDGISLLLCNTPKGKQAVEALREQFEMTELDVEKASYNNRIQVSEQRKAKHDAFLRRYEEKGLRVAYNEFLPLSAKAKAKNWVTRRLRRKRKGRA